MNVYNLKDDKVPFGYGRCWACGRGWLLPEIIKQITGIDGETWLADNGYLFDSDVIKFENLIGGWHFNSPQVEFKTHFTEDDVTEFAKWYHPYLAKRKLSPATCQKFKVGYDIEHKCITFPVYDIDNKLITVTERSVISKRFLLEKNIPKYIYLLNNAYEFEQECLREYGELKPIFVVESQINALTLAEWGFTSIALIGTGCKQQYDLIKECLLTRNFYLCFDGDVAGDEGAKRFLTNFPNSIKIDIPRGKDVNDLSYFDFINLIS